MNDELRILKIGGKLVDDSDKLDSVLEAVTGYTTPVIVVHGGGDQASRLSRKLGMEPRMVAGRRITDEPTLKVAVMVYAGSVNKKLVAGLQAKAINAIGLTGADGNLIRAHKRKCTEIDYGFAGDIAPETQSNEVLNMLLKQGLVPVFCALTHDGHGQMLNTNADTIAAHLATRLANEYKVRLIYCLDKPGVLADPRHIDSVIDKLTESHFRKLKQNGNIAEGMIPKLDNAFNALRVGVWEVILCDWRGAKSLKGTVLCQG